MLSSLEGVERRFWVKTVKSVRCSGVRLKGYTMINAPLPTRLLGNSLLRSAPESSSSGLSFE